MQSRQIIYEELSPIFQLLYLYDIEKYQLKQLRNLIKELKTSEPLSADMQRLYKKLEEVSKQNVADKIRKKKENRISSIMSSNVQAEISRLQASDIWDPPKRNNNQSTLNQTNFPIDESVYIDAPDMNYRELQTKSGSIIAGRFLASFALSYLNKEKSMNVIFHVNPKRQESTISKQTLAEMNLKSVQPTLLVDNHRQNFKVSQQNILGLSYLQNNKIIMKSNYRSEASQFKMTYTE